MKHTNTFIVHHLQCIPKHLSLQDAVYLFPNIPMILISYKDEVVRVSCNIPQEFLSNKFNAQIWMKVIFQVFNQKFDIKKNINSLTTINIKFKNVSKQDANTLIETAVTEAARYASTLIDKSN